MWRRRSPASIRPVSTTSRNRPACSLALRLGVAAAGLIVFPALLGAGAAIADVGLAPCRPGSKPMARVELYFGGKSRDEAAWHRFVADVVTPRFPQGLTGLEGSGQWGGPKGLTREHAHILVIFYTPDRTSDARIEAIRALYKSRFRQKSVLRADSAACVGF